LGCSLPQKTKGSKDMGKIRLSETPCKCGNPKEYKHRKCDACKRKTYERKCLRNRHYTLEYGAITSYRNYDSYHVYYNYDKYMSKWKDYKPL